MGSKEVLHIRNLKGSRLDDQRCEMPVARPAAANGAQAVVATPEKCRVLDRVLKKPPPYPQVTSD